MKKIGLFSLAILALSLSLTSSAYAIEIPGMETKKENPLAVPELKPEDMAEKIKVTDIVVNGTERKESALIAMVIKIGDVVTPAQIREDLQRVFGLGYFTDVTGNKEAYQDGFRIVINVVENPILKEVKILGNNIIKTQEFKDIFNNDIGKIINLNDIKEGIEISRKLYTDQGYQAVSINPQLTPDGVIALYINEGVLEEIRVVGNAETRTDIIMREIRQKPGDVFNIDIIRDDLRRVYNTNFFENVDIDPKPGIKDPSHIILNIKIKEKQTGSVNLGAAYNTRDGIVGTFSISKDNVFGSGQKILAELQAGAGWLSATGANWLGRLDWYEPWFLPQYLPARTGVGFSIYRQRQGNFFQDINPFKLAFDNVTADSRYILINDRTGFSLNLGSAILGDPLTTPWRVSGSVRAEQIAPAIPRIDDVLIKVNKVDKVYSDLKNSKLQTEKDIADKIKTNFDSYVQKDILNALTVSKKGFDNRLSLSLSLSYDTRNFAADPREGWNNIASIEPSFGDVSYWKYFLTLNKYSYIPLPWIDNLTFAFGGRLGVLAGDPKKISVYERFFSGGFDTIRGWPENGYLSGENVFVGSAEIRFPIYNMPESNQKLVSGVLFFDAGNFWNQSWGVTEANINDVKKDGKLVDQSLLNPFLRYGVGLGVRINTPLGALRADYGIRDISRPFDMSKGAQFHFNIGQKF